MFYILSDLSILLKLIVEKENITIIVILIKHVFKGKHMRL